MNTQSKHSLNNDTDSTKDKALNSKDDNFKELLSEDLNRNSENTEIPEADNTELLNEFLDQVKPIDFKLLAFPEIVELREEKKKLESKLINPDGSYKSGGNKADNKRLEQINKNLDYCKVTRKHYLILIVEQLHKIAKANDWGLCKKNEKIYLYNGEYWRLLDEDQFKFFLGNVALKMNVEKFTGKHFHFKDDLFKQFLSESFLEPPTGNDKKVLINLKNGTYEISPNNHKLREFRREDFLTYQLPFEYNKNATAPIFQRYLDQVLPDKEKQTVIAEYLGYVFMKNGSLKIEKSLMCYGTGRNGKSVLFEIVKALLGKENVSSYSLEDLTKNKNSRAGIVNKLVNYSGEISGRIDAGEFKTLSSGEDTSVKILYKDEFVTNQYAKLIFNANKLPIDVEHTDGYFERFLIIHFDQYIKPEDRDGDLHSKIIDKELAGVFNWILDGLKRVLKQRKLSRCESAENMLDNFKKESDSVKLFIEEFDYKPQGEQYTKVKDLYRQYFQYCAENGYQRVNNGNFRRRLQHHRILVEKISAGYVAYVTSSITNFEPDNFY